MIAQESGVICQMKAILSYTAVKNSKVTKVISCYGRDGRFMLLTTGILRNHS